MLHPNSLLRSSNPLILSLMVLLLATSTIYSQSALAQPPLEVDEELLRKVFRDADNFSAKEGEPPVYRAYKQSPDSAEPELIGYLFETPDLPPEEVGYSAPIDVLVGMDLEGTLTGIEVLYYRESYKSIRGDFINSEYFPNQFDDKNVADGFRVGRDIDGISRATMTSWAVARGVRNAARRVAQAYLSDSEFVNAANSDAVALQILEGQSWEEMIDSGLVMPMKVIQPDQTELDLFIAFMGHDGLGELLVGADDYSRADRDASSRVSNGNMVMVGIDGNSSQPFRQERLAVQQGEDVYPIERRRFVYVGSAEYGKIKDKFRFAGAMVLSPEVDIAQPFSILYNTGGTVGEFGGIFSAEYQVPPVPLALAQGTPLPPEFMPFSEFDEFDDDFGYEQESFLASLTNDAPWTEVAILIALLAMVMAGFLRKSANIRWATLAVTLFYLGWMNGGFVSVSHITNVIKIGPDMFRNDLPQVLILLFTIITTLFWGRVMCSSLCPFGALQDFITRIVPKKLRFQVPQAIHDKALYIKYAILAFLIVTSLAYTEISLFQYFEPFGTIFYISQSLVLWAILAFFLLGSVFISRFYCRYACPLGAALGVTSLLSPWRIKRIEQCQVCKVCEHSCPTGAIRGPDIDFKECVRCDICEIKLIDKAGVCKHSVEKVKSRVKDWQPVTVMN